LKVSRNELIELLKLAFEGLGFDQGDYENAAKLVTHAEMWGLGGLEVLARALVGASLQPHQAVQVLREDHHSAVIDGQNLSSLLCLRSAADLAYVKCLSSPVGKVTITRCQHRLLVFQHLIGLSLRWVTCSASWWAGPEDNVLHVLSVLPGERTPSPEYKVYQVIGEKVKGEKLTGDNNGLTSTGQLEIYSAQSSQAMSAHLAELLPPSADLIKTLNSGDMLANYESSLVDGIGVDDALWFKLVSLAAEMLVPSSDQSRSGAGD